MPDTKALLKSSTLSFLLLLLFVPLTAFSQTFSTARLLEAWQVEGVNHLFSKLSNVDLVLPDIFNDVGFFYVLFLAQVCVK